jgi:hypothetical protein
VSAHAEDSELLALIARIKATAINVPVLTETLFGIRILPREPRQLLECANSRSDLALPPFLSEANAPKRSLPALDGEGV